MKQILLIIFLALQVFTVGAQNRKGIATLAYKIDTFKHGGRKVLIQRYNKKELDGVVMTKNPGFRVAMSLNSLQYLLDKARTDIANNKETGYLYDARSYLEKIELEDKNFDLTRYKSEYNFYDQFNSKIADKRTAPARNELEQQQLARQKKEDSIAAANKKWYADVKKKEAEQQKRDAETKKRTAAVTKRDATTKKNNATPAKTTVPVNTPEPNGDINISAAKLLADYSDNEIRADKVYKGRTLRVTGLVHIVSSFAGKHYVMLTSANSGFKWVQCFFDDPNDIESLSKGMKVAIQGVCSGKLVNVQLRNCSLKAL